MDVTIPEIFARQDQLITRLQALLTMSQDELATKLRRYWGVALPGIYSSSPGQLSNRQRARAALLHAGPEAMLHDLWALRNFGLPFLPDDPFVRTLVPDTTQPSTREFVVIRRTTRLPTPLIVNGFPTAPVCRSVCEFILRHRDQRDGLAVAAAAVQLGKVSVEELAAEAKAGAAPGRARLLRVIFALEAGVRSAPEEDFRQLVLRRRGLPEPKWNWLIELPGGIRISPDALWLEAGLIHETNGKQFHAADQAGESAFEDMQRRHDAAVVAGLTALHNAPSRISRDGLSVIREVEAVYRRQAGCGLPPGVRVLRAGPPPARRGL